jgi:hypothetical protein
VTKAEEKEHLETMQKEAAKDRKPLFVKPGLKSLHAMSTPSNSSSSSLLCHKMSIPYVIVKGMDTSEGTRVSKGSECHLVPVLNTVVIARDTHTLEAERI